jgi:hypothetical protein
VREREAARTVDGAVPLSSHPPTPDARLFVVYLGGDVAPGRMGEDHEVVLVVAQSPKEARRRARSKWSGTGRAHVDALAEVRRIDGHTVRLVADGPDGDEIDLDPTYVP